MVRTGMPHVLFCYLGRLQVRSQESARVASGGCKCRLGQSNDVTSVNHSYPLFLTDFVTQPSLQPSPQLVEQQIVDVLTLAK